MQKDNGMVEGARECKMIQKFEFHQTKIQGLLKIAPFCAEDIRGCFTKDYSREVFEANGIHHDLAEVFYTTSYKGVIRALHFQREKQQPKLVRCVFGHVWDVVGHADQLPQGRRFSCQGRPVQCCSQTLH